MPASSWLDRLHPVARAAVVLLGVLPAVAYVKEPPRKLEWSAGGPERGPQ